VAGQARRFVRQFTAPSLVFVLVSPLSPVFALFTFVLVLLFSSPRFFVILPCPPILTLSACQSIPIRQFLILPGTVGSDAVGIKTALSVPDASRDTLGVNKTEAASVPLGAVGIQTAINAPKAPVSINTADSSQVRHLSSALCVAHPLAAPDEQQHWSLSIGMQPVSLFCALTLDFL
jgi:hypothetical protein